MITAPFKQSGNLVQDSQVGKLGQAKVCTQESED